jgi:hypothetical protein
MSTVASGSIGGAVAWDDTSWSALGEGTHGLVHALTLFNGQLIAGGDFDSAGAVSANNIAAWRD